METTAHYQLKKPSYTEGADIQALNDNADIVDVELAAQSKQLTALDAAKAAKSIMAPVTLMAADWVEDAENGWWTQGISNPAIVDGHKVDISASPAVVKQISEAGATLVLENNAGTATIYSLGAVPTIDITIAIRISEVNTQ